MIKASCKTIQDFFSIKERCIFCHKLLTPLLSNTINDQDFNNSLSDINSFLKNDQFNFVLKYDGESSSFRVSAFINIKNNRFGFYHNQSSQNIHDEQIKDFFLGLLPHIMLVCKDKKCDTGYFLQSYSIGINNNDNSIKPIILAMEAFKTNKLYVINYYYPNNSENYTTIYSKTNYDKSGISFPRLDFEAQPKDKLIHRIQTIVNFS